MTVYEGDFIQITYEKQNDLIRLYWKTSPTTQIELKSELLISLSFFKKYTPKYSLWINEEIEYVIDKELAYWIENTISKPIREGGLEKACFVICKNISYHISIITMFDLLPYELKHFTTEKEARSWLFNKKKTRVDKLEKKQNDKILFEGVDEEGNPIFKFKSKSKNISHTLKFLNKFLERDDIISTYQCKFNTLTHRELEIIKMFSEGKKITQIADILFISIHTARTHWKNIKQKLELKDNSEIVKVTKIFFEMI